MPSLRSEIGRNVRIFGNKPAAREEQLVHLYRRSLSLMRLASTIKYHRFTLKQAYQNFRKQGCPICKNSIASSYVCRKPLKGISECLENHRKQYQNFRKQASPICKNSIVNHSRFQSINFQAALRRQRTMLKVQFSLFAAHSHPKYHGTRRRRRSGGVGGQRCGRAWLASPSMGLACRWARKRTTILWLQQNDMVLP